MSYINNFHTNFTKKAVLFLNTVIIFYFKSIIHWNNNNKIRWSWEYILYYFARVSICVSACWWNGQVWKEKKYECWISRNKTKRSIREIRSVSKRIKKWF